VINKSKPHNPYLPKVKELLARFHDMEDWLENGQECQKCFRCGKRQADGFTLNISHVNDDGAEDRRRAGGNAYYKLLYDRVRQEAEARQSLSLELLCLECHGNPKRTDKRGFSKLRR
jgi:hypothetical protein